MLRKRTSTTFNIIRLCGTLLTVKALCLLCERRRAPDFGNSTSINTSRRLQWICNRKNVFFPIKKLLLTNTVLPTRRAPLPSQKYFMKGRTAMSRSLVSGEVRNLGWNHANSKMVRGSMAGGQPSSPQSTGNMPALHSMHSLLVSTKR